MNLRLGYEFDLYTVSKKECALPISVLRKDDYHGTLLYLFQTSFHKLLAILSCCSCFVALAFSL